MLRCDHVTSICAGNLVIFNESSLAMTNETIDTLRVQNGLLEDNTLQAAKATSQLNSQLADVLARGLELEADKKAQDREIEKLEEQVALLQVCVSIQ